jgi:choline kinase
LIALSRADWRSVLVRRLLAAAHVHRSIPLPQTVRFAATKCHTFDCPIAPATLLRVSRADVTNGSIVHPERMSHAGLFDRGRTGMKVVLLAAGVGQRLGDGPEHRPKALLRFGSQTLLERHLVILRAFGITDIALAVGYRADLVSEEIDRLGLLGRIQLIKNQHYREGSILSVWAAREIFGSGAPVLLMDADVLYDHRLMARLLDSTIANCLLLDRNIEPGEEPVKICVRGDRIVDFRKRPQADYDWHGESVGFFRFSPSAARELVGRVADYVGAEQRLLEYEEPIRDMMLESPQGRFGFEDITGLPWVEIDFPEDVQHAREIVWPRLDDTAALSASFPSWHSAKAARR